MTGAGNSVAKGFIKTLLAQKLAGTLREPFGNLRASTPTKNHATKGFLRSRQ